LLIGSGTKKVERLNKVKVKVFFGYKRRDSVRQILFNLGIPSFNTVVHNSRAASRASWCNSHNSIVEHLESVCGL